MAFNPKRSIAAVNAEADAVCALLNDGYLRIYDGAQPDTADTPVNSQTLLAELRFNATAFAPAIDGVALANAIAVDAAADNTGTAAWFRALKSDGLTPVLDGTAGISSCDIALTTVDIVQNAEVSLSRFSYSAAKE